MNSYYIVGTVGSTQCSRCVVIVLWPPVQYSDLANGVSLPFCLLQSSRVPHLQLLYCRQKRLVGHGDLCPELGTDALGQSSCTEAGYQLTDVLLSPAAVHLCVFERGTLEGGGGGGGEWKKKGDRKEIQRREREM